jgi:hypothetical protein
MGPKGISRQRNTLAPDEQRASDMGLGTVRVNGPAIAMHAPRRGPAHRLALMKACADSLSIEIDNSGRHQCEAHLAGGRLGSLSSRSFARVEFTPPQYENWQEISVNQGWN